LASDPPLDQELAPNIAEFVGEFAQATFELPFPAVTVPVQTTFATGRSPESHGDVSSRRYDRANDVDVLLDTTAPIATVSVRPLLRPTSS
jgi:predicted AlkP superfamily pyrophosphatase or phosphodiesterase